MRLSPDATKELNAVCLIGVSAILMAAYVFQFVLAELPCPLCLLQRVAFAFIAFGLLLNVRYGSNPQHYAIMLLSALFGMVVSGRQVLLHIVPGTGAYGSAIFGLHFYTWAFLLFGLTILGVAVMLLLPLGQMEPELGTRSKIISTAAGWLAISIILLNAVTTFVQCGPIECPDDPTGYWLLGG